MSLALSVPSIETDRLVLRGWRAGDLDSLVEFYEDRDNVAFIGAIESRGEVWRRLATFIGHWALRGFGMWAVTEKPRDDFIGWCGMWFPEDWPEPEIGWALARVAQGRGLATEAAIAARRHAYDHLGWATAISLIDPNNAASERVAERLGARFERIHHLRGKDVGVFRHPSPPDVRPTHTAVQT